MADVPVRFARAGASTTTTGPCDSLLRRLNLAESVRPSRAGYGAGLLVRFLSGGSQRPSKARATSPNAETLRPPLRTAAT